MIESIDNIISITSQDNITQVTSITNTNVIQEREVVAITNTITLDNNYTCGSNIGGHKVVYLNNDKIEYASNDNVNCLNKVIGLSIQAGNADTSIKVKRDGIIELTNWGLIPNSIYYLGLNGEITNIIPNTGIYQIIGIAKNSNQLEIKINVAINRG